MLLSLLASSTPSVPSNLAAGFLISSFSGMSSMYKSLQNAGSQSGTGRGVSSRQPAAVRSRLMSVAVAASVSQQSAKYSTRSSKSSKAEAAAAEAAVQQLKSMLHVRGIGKKYETILRGQGIKTVEELSSNIINKLEDQAGERIALSPAMKYLQDLGIKRQDHAQRIITHLTSIYAPELHSQLQLAAGDASSADQKGPQITLCVEGNISAGKSTFLGYITNNNEELQGTLGVVHEPVDQWQSVPTVSGDTLNLLDKFYSDPPKYAYTFQNFVFMSRVLQERNSNGMSKPVRLMERSVFSDRMVFVRAVRESGWMGDVELAVYDSWFTPILESNPSLKPDGFIYLQCTPSTCMERLKMRGRHEEDSISMEYLEGLHNKHEDWLKPDVTASQKQKQLSKLSRRRHQQYSRSAGGLLVPVPAKLEQSLYFLDTAWKDAPRDMHPSLHDVPALVLDCNHDALRDLDLQREVQAQVADYISYMRKLKQQQKKLKQQQGNTHSVGFEHAAHGSQPGAPEGRAAEHCDLVQNVGRIHDARIVPNTSGTLAQNVDAAEGLIDSVALGHSSSRSAATTGIQEALFAAQMAIA